MKSPILKVVFVFCFVIVSLLAFSQCTAFYSDPQNKSELDASNCYLAQYFAPVMFHFANAENNPDESLVRDIPTIVNYDGDFDHTNNWDQVHLVDNTLPSAYYAVTWTEQIYIITYSYYFPRDWADTNIPSEKNACQHEGDIEKVYVYVERSNMKIRGWTVTNHGNRDITEDDGSPCGTYPVINFTTSSEYYNGEHPAVYTSTGSHAIFLTYDRAKTDATTSQNFCKPDPDFVVALVPGNTPNSWNDNFEPGTEDVDDWNEDENFTMYVSTYELFDIFEPISEESAGLWHIKDNNHPETGFCTGMDWGYIDEGSEIESNRGKFKNYNNQEIYCDNFCVGGLETGTPWSGELSAETNQLQFITENIGTFDCCFGDPNCSQLTFTDCQILHSEYLCDTYRIRKEGLWEDGNNVVATLPL